MHLVRDNKNTHNITGTVFRGERILCYLYALRRAIVRRAAMAVAASGVVHRFTVEDAGAGAAQRSHK